VSVEAPTRAEALAKLREQLQKRLKNGTELIAVPLTAEEHPLAKFAGMFKDDADFAEVRKIIAANRRKADKRRKGP
jgi:2-iminoacetate synthase ThiH